MPSKRLSVSIIVPARNEASTIKAAIEAVVAVGVATEILAVDDGSSDETHSILQDLRASRPDLLRVFRHDRGRGKGAAIATALAHAQGDIVAIQDADLEYDPRDLPKLVAAFSDPTVAAVYGSRILQNNPRSSARFYWGGRILSWATSALYGTRITDEPTGYKLFRADVLRALDLQQPGFEFCPEATGKLLRGGHRIVELPIRYAPRSFAEGKKIRWRHGISALWTLLSIRLRARPSRYSSRLATFLCAALLGLVAILGWGNTLDAPFVLDDLGSIRDNPSIQPPYALDSLLSPPSADGQTVGGRPLLNLSFAANYAISGQDPWSYRAVNIGIHFLATLLLFGLLRRSIALWQERQFLLRAGRTAPSLAAALLWAAHPLTTAAISYTAQRAESLAALLYLLALYAAARALRSARPGAWQGLAIFACWCGVGVKETVVTLPLAVALFDYVFLDSSSIKGQWRKRKWLHIGLLASWLPLGLLMASTDGRGGTAGFAFGAATWEYMTTQFWAVTHYLRLALWPDPLVFDYGRQFAIVEAGQWLPRALLLAALVIASLVGLAKRHPLSLAAALAFLFLAPTSTIVPIADRVFEHRFYLPLAAVVAILSFAAFRFLPRLAPPLIGLAAFACLLQTHARNELYRDPVALWQDTIAKVPTNARAHNNLASLQLDQGDIANALDHFARAVELEPSALALSNYANALALDEQFDRAVARYKQALSLNQDYGPAQLGMAETLAASGQPAEAIAPYRAYLEGRPDSPIALRGLGKTYLLIGDNPKATRLLARVTELRPRDAQAFFELGDALAQAQRLPEAQRALEQAVELDPTQSEALANLGNLYLMSQQFDKAIQTYQRSLALHPTPMVHANLGVAYYYARRPADAKRELQSALKLDPNYRPAAEILRQLP